MCVKGHVCLEAGLIGRNMRIVWHVPLCSLAQSACELTVGMIMSLLGETMCLVSCVQYERGKGMSRDGELRECLHSAACAHVRSSGRNVLSFDSRLQVR